MFNNNQQWHSVGSCFETGHSNAILPSCSSQTFFSSSNKATQINDKVTAEATKEVLAANNETPVKIAKVKNKVDKVKTKYSAYKEKAKTPDETKTISLEEEKELSAVKYAAILEAFDIEDTDTSETKEGEENA